jgi:hypothetical protein
MLRRTVAAALLIVLVAVISGCSTPDGQNETPGSTSPPAAGQPTGNESLGEAPVLADGRHPVLPTNVDVAGRKVTFDLIVFLTGQAAKDEWAKQNPQDPQGPPNDYMVVNNNPLLRTLPVSASVVVKAVKEDAGTLDPVPIPFADLPAQADPPGSRIFWITVAKGQITLIEEQFVP